MKDNLESGRFKNDILRRIGDESKISVSSPADRAAYLMNAVNGIEEASAHGARCFLTITSEVSSTYSRKQIGHILKEILRARIKGYTCSQIATFFKVRKEAIEALEELAKLELEESLKAKGFVNIFSRGTDDTLS